MIINDKPKHFSGLSTDTKPTLGMNANGYTFSELDSGLEYSYDVRLGVWVNISAQSDTACVGIAKIDKTSSKGLVDYYTITYTNGSETSFTVTNGTKVTISDNNTWLIDGKDTGVSTIGAEGPRGPRGIQGIQGEQGVSITGIHKTETIGDVTFYCINYSDGTHDEFEVNRGLQGEQGVQGEKGDTGATPILGVSSTHIISTDPKTSVVTEVVALEDLKGPKGDKGDKGAPGPRGLPGNIADFDPTLVQKPNGVYVMKARVNNGSVTFYWELEA